MTEVGCEPLVVGPSSDPGLFVIGCLKLPSVVDVPPDTLSVTVPSAETEAVRPGSGVTMVATCWFLMSEFGCLTVAMDLLLCCTVLGRGELTWE